MTVASTVVRATAAWTGVETEFPTGIQVQERSQLVVSLIPIEGDRRALTLGLHYSVVLSPVGVATVVPLAAFPVARGTVSMVRQTPMTQGYDPTATDTYDAEGHAAALDRSAMRVAELSHKVDDIEASAIVIEGGGASVPEGAVYVSDGHGKAVAGPTALEIEAARVAAVNAAGTATGAAGVATGAATAAGAAAALADQLANAEPGTAVGEGFSARHWAALAKALADAFDLAKYPTTDQIVELLGGFVPTSRKIKVGAGLSLDAVPGSEAHPIEGDLSGDRLLGLASLSLETWKAGTDTTPASISPAILAATLKVLAGGASPRGVVEISASGSYKPSPGTKLVLAILRGAGGSGAGNQSGSGGGGGGEGALSLPLISVNDAATYAVAVGAGGPARPGGNNGIAGGDTSIVVDGVTYIAGGGQGGYTYGVGGTGGVPSSTCFLGVCGTSGGGNYNGTSAWRQAGAAYGQGGGASQAPGSPGTAVGGAGYAGHITILEFGS